MDLFLIFSLKKGSCGYNFALPSQATHDVNDKNQLLSLVRKYLDGIAVVDLKDAYPNVMEDLKVCIVIIGKTQR